MTTAIKTFTKHCVSGIEADAGACARPLMSSIAQATSLVPTIGYKSAANVAKLIDQGLTLEEALTQLKYSKSETSNLIGEADAK